MSNLLRKSKGFSLVETLLAVAIVSTLSTIAIPKLMGAMKSYRLSSAVAACTGAIQSTRYMAIMRGYPYQLTFDATSRTYQIASQPPGAPGFVSVPPGTAIPIASGKEETINQTTVLQFNSNGTVTSGNPVFTVSNGAITKQISVSGVGYVSVTPVTP